MPDWPCLLIFPNLAKRAFEPFFTVAFAVCFGVPPRFPEPPRPLLYFLPIVLCCSHCAYRSVSAETASAGLLVYNAAFVARVYASRVSVSVAQPREQLGLAL